MIEDEDWNRKKLMRGEVACTLPLSPTFFFAACYVPVEYATCHECNILYAYFILVFCFRVPLPRSDMIHNLAPRPTGTINNNVLVFIILNERENFSY